MPPFNKSAMDGYACRRADLDGPLRVIDVIEAGHAPRRAVGAGECAKIMTGAMVPEGADCVIVVEQTEAIGGDTVRFTGTTTRDNICLQGEDVRAGDCVLRKGHRIAPQHVAVLAACGCVRPRVSCRPRVGVMATGDELVEPDVRPAATQIRTSNSSQLCAQVRTAGGVPTYYGITRDVEEDLDRTLKTAIAGSDVVLVSGGVSMGDRDFVPGVMARNGLRILFDAIAIKPGKPTTFGVSDEACCIGLPGNPVSTFVVFELLVRPFLYWMMGHDYRPVHISGPLAESVSRRRTERESWIPVAITAGNAVSPIPYHGSAHIGALGEAGGLLRVPAGVATIPKGTRVDVRPI